MANVSAAASNRTKRTPSTGWRNIDIRSFKSRSFPRNLLLVFGWSNLGSVLAFRARGRHLRNQFKSERKLKKFLDFARKLNKTHTCLVFFFSLPESSTPFSAKMCLSAKQTNETTERLDRRDYKF